MTVAAQAKKFEIESGTLGDGDRAPSRNVKRRNRRNKRTKLRDLSAIAIVAAASFFLAIDSDHIFFAAVFAAQAVAAAVLAVWIAREREG